MDMVGLGRGFLGGAGKDAHAAGNSVNNADNAGNTGSKANKGARRGRHTKQAVEQMQQAPTSLSSPTSPAPAPPIQAGKAGVSWTIGSVRSASTSHALTQTPSSHSAVDKDQADQSASSWTARNTSNVRQSGQQTTQQLTYQSQQQTMQQTMQQSQLQSAQQVQQQPIQQPIQQSSQKPIQQSKQQQKTAIPTILFVCHGNICRSVTGEYLLRHAALQYGKRISNGNTVEFAGDKSDTTVAVQPDCIIRSCGLLRHMHGSPAEPTIVQLLRERGVDASDSRSQFVQAHDLQEATVVLCFSRGQANELIDIEPRAARKIFLIDEFAMLCQAALQAQRLQASSTCAERLQQIISLAPMLRPLIAPAKGVEDPFGKEYEVFVRSVSLIESSVQTIARTLFAH